MRLTILAVGTRGDVQPYAALGSGLRRGGHTVRLATHERFRGLVEDCGLEFHALPGDPNGLFEQRSWESLAVSRWRPVGHVRELRALIESLLEDLDLDAVRRPCTGADAIVFTTTTTFGHGVAHDLGVPAVLATCGPALPTTAFPHPVVAPDLAVGGRANYLSWLVGERLQRQTFQEPLRPAARRALGLPRVPGSGLVAGDAWPPFPVLGGFSPAILPRPRDWPAHARVTGSWFPPADGGALPPEAEDFLAAGPAPVYIGFGSMGARRIGTLGEIIRDALRSTGNRAIVVGSAARAIPEAGDDILILDSVRHDLLFPRVKGVVHHGGSGTVASGLRAGRPTLVVPFIFDQFFWGRRVWKLGAGPKPIPYERLTGARLAQALAGFDTRAVVDAADRLGGRIRAEDGVGEAVRVLEEVLA